MKNKKPAVYRLLSGRGKLYAILLLLSACTPSISGNFCDIYEPVFPDYENDTAETIRQIDRNNAVYDLCG